MNRKRRLHSGFSLIEIIISFAIFAILLIAFFSMMMTIFKISQQSKQQYQATVLAQKHFEELKAVKEIVTGHITHKYEDYIIDEEISEVEEYEGRLYKIIVKVSRDEKVIEALEGLKIIKK